jgi:hypothetical protein
MMAVCSSAWMVIHSRQSSVASAPSLTPQPPVVDLAQDIRPSPTPDASPRDAEINSPAVPVHSTPTVVSETPAKPMPPTPNKPSLNVPALASPPIRPFEPPPIVLPRLPAVLEIRNLDRGDGKEQLTAQFDGGSAVRIDVFTRDTIRATDRLNSALKKKGVQVLSDVAADPKRRQKGAYLVYCDDLSTSDWIQLLRDVGVADRSAEARRAGDGVFDDLVVMPIVPPDQKELERVIGVDPLTHGRSKPGTTDRKPAPSKSESTKKTAVLAYRSVSAPSKEIRSFFENRQDRLAGGIPVMLVVRTSS